MIFSIIRFLILCHPSLSCYKVKKHLILALFVLGKKTSSSPSFRNLSWQIKISIFFPSSLYFEDILVQRLSNAMSGGRFNQSDISRYNVRNTTKALLELNRDKKLSPKIYIESQNYSGWRDIRTSFVQFSTQSRSKLWGQTTMLRVLFSLVLNMSKNRETKQSLWKTCSTPLTVLKLKKSFHVSSLNITSFSLHL